VKSDEAAVNHLGSIISKGRQEARLLDAAAAVVSTLFTLLVFYGSNPLSNEFLLGLIALDALLIPAVVGVIQFATPVLDELDSEAAKIPDVAEKVEREVRKYMPTPSLRYSRLIRRSSFAMAFSILLFLFTAAVLALAALSHVVPNPSFLQATKLWILVGVSFWLMSWGFVRCLFHLASVVSKSTEKSRG